MSSYLNNLLTNTTSRYNNLRRQLLSEEADGDTEDDSHLSRVLRAYYTEKGLPFPQWLPPDPKTPQPQPAQFASSGGRQQQGQMSPTGRGGGRGGGGLSDLWDSPQQQPPPQEPLSLRRAAGGRGGPRQMHGQSQSPEPQSQGRPLPSQRAGSYQSSLTGRQQAEPSPPLSAGSATTAQDRLKARLWGSGRSGQSASSGERSPALGGRPSHTGERSGSYGSSQSGGSSSRQESFLSMSSHSPWEADDDSYASQNQPQPNSRGGRVGLPSGPRMR